MPIEVLLHDVPYRTCTVRYGKAVKDDLVVRYNTIRDAMNSYFYLQRIIMVRYDNEAILKHIV